MRNKPWGRSLLPIIISMLLAGAVLITTVPSCCSSQDKTTDPDKITKGQFLALQKARKKLGHFSNEMSGAIKSSYPLETQLENSNKVTRKYEEAFPEYSPFYLNNQNPQPQIPEDTLTNDLLNIMFESKSGNHETMAYYVAQEYLLAVHILKGLPDFQQFVLEHTRENGTFSNPSNPFEDIQAGYNIFGSYPMNNGIFVNTMIDPASGAVRYSSRIGDWGEDDVSNDPQHTEYLFLQAARELMKKGDTLLVEQSNTSD
ncbi:MAG: hypothetical protein JW738_08855 [Actinobacteria bacterium]|nr:hypothetical protein [Actinomycetota bacterium]